MKAGVTTLAGWMTLNILFQSIGIDLTIQTTTVYLIQSLNFSLGFALGHHLFIRTETFKKATVLLLILTTYVVSLAVTSNIVLSLFAPPVFLIVGAQLFASLVRLGWIERFNHLFDESESIEENEVPTVVESVLKSINYIMAGGFFLGFGLYLWASFAFGFSSLSEQSQNYIIHAGTALTVAIALLIPYLYRGLTEHLTITTPERYTLLAIQIGLSAFAFWRFIDTIPHLSRPYGFIIDLLLMLSVLAIGSWFVLEERLGRIPKRTDFSIRFNS
jgi:hypothetical protein